MQSGRARGRHGDKLEPAPEPRTTFQFPKMPFSEIQEDMALNNCDYPITKESFRSPAPEDVTKVAEFFTNEFYSKRVDDFVQPAFGCLDNVDYPELFEDAIPQFNFLRQCQKMFADAKFTDFGLRDLHAPDRNRFQWQLSALINMHKFRQTRVAMVEEAVGNFEEMAEKERLSGEERSQLEREIGVIEQARAKDEPQLKEVRQGVAELELELSSLHKQQIHLTERTREAKAKFAKQTEYVAGVKVKRMSEAEEVDRYRSRVVSSPDRVKAEIGSMEETVASESECVSGVEKKTQETRVRSGAVEKCGSDVERVVVATEGVLREQQTAKNLQAEVEEGKKKLKEGEREIKSIESSKTHLERVVSSIHQKLARIGEQNSDFQRQTSREDRELAEKESEHEMADMELGRKTEAMVGAVEGVKESMADEGRRFLDEVEAFANKQAVVHEMLAGYHADLEKSQGLISSDLERSEGRFRAEAAGGV